MAVEIITTVLSPAAASSPAAPYDLTDLTAAKTELKIADTLQDAFLSRIITAASNAIAKYCNRVFAVEGIQDLCYIEQDAYPYQVPGGVGPLQLSRWPIQPSTAPVSFTGTLHGSTLVDGISSMTGLSIGVGVAGAGIPAGTTIAALAPTTANSITLSATATSSASGVSLTVPLSVVEIDIPANVGGVLGAGMINPLLLGTDYTIDAARGWLIRLNPFTGVPQKWPATPILAVYSAGYSSSNPSDAADLAILEDAALRLVTGRFAARDRDPSLMQRDTPGLGVQRFWVGTAPGQKGALPPEVENMVDPYRVPMAL